MSQNAKELVLWRFRITHNIHIFAQAQTKIHVKHIQMVIYERGGMRIRGVEKRI